MIEAYLMLQILARLFAQMITPLLAVPVFLNYSQWFIFIPIISTIVVSTFAAHWDSTKFLILQQFFNWTLLWTVLVWRYYAQYMPKLQPTLIGLILAITVPPAFVLSEFVFFGLISTNEGDLGLFGTFHAGLWTRLKSVWTRLKSVRTAIGRIRDSVFEMSGKLVDELKDVVNIVLDGGKKILDALGDICGVEHQAVTEVAQAAQASTDLPPYYSAIDSQDHSNQLKPEAEV